MRKKLVTILLVISFLNVVSFSFLLVQTSAIPTTEPIVYEPIDIGPRLRDTKLSLSVFSESGSNSKPQTSSLPEGAIQFWLLYDDYFGAIYLTLYELRAVGVHCEIWVQINLAWPEGDPRSTPIITDEQVAYLRDEFDNIIYPRDTEYFGEEDFHNGTLGGPWGDYYDEVGKSVILVSNVRDENYWYSDYPYYIAGFYWSLLEDFFDRNIISIDAYDWENRVGDDVARPNLYEGVIAHEYQHLIHDDHFEESALWMNEGCSMFAEVLCGYPTDWSSINSFLATPDNSLTQWGDQGDINILADYGQVYLWASYIVDNYGSDILKNYIMGKIPGVAGLNLLFADLFTDFEAVFHEWTMANLMRTGYTKIDFDDKEAGDLRIYEVKDKWPTGVYGTDFGNTISVLGYDTGISRVGSYGTDYILLSKLKWQYPSMLTFDGDDYAWTPHWIKDGSAWYSTRSEALSALDLFLDVVLGEESVLTIDTFYEIEKGWDFGFVQIYNETLGDWVSLTNDYTTDEHEGTTEAIQAYLPGLTGDSGDWITMDFDLTGYSGPSTIRFSYMTDWGYQDPGWWVDNIAIDGTFVSEDDFWLDLPPETSFLVSVLRQDFWDGEYHYNLITEFDVSGSNVFVLDLADFLSSPGKNLRYPDVVLAITPRVGLADYTFSVVPII